MQAAKLAIVGSVCLLLSAGIASAADVSPVTPPAAQFYEDLQQRISPTGLTLVPGLLEAGLLLEVEASYASQGAKQSSDLILATFELGLDCTPHENLKGHALFLWEQDETEPMDLDEGHITLGDSAAVPFYLSAGRLYLPFGVYYSHFINSPLTDKLGETRKTAAVAGYRHDLGNLAGGVFRRDITAADAERLNRFCGALTLTPADGVELGGALISDLAESDELWEGVKDAATKSGVSHVTVPGANAFLHLSQGIFEFDVETILALKDFGAGELADDEQRPQTWNFELACAPHARWEIAARYEHGRDFPGYPERQYGGCVSWKLMEHARLAAEYLYGEFAGDTADRHLATLQLGFEI